MGVCLYGGRYEITTKERLQNFKVHLTVFDTFQKVPCVITCLFQQYHVKSWLYM